MRLVSAGQNARVFFDIRRLDGITPKEGLDGTQPVLSIDGDPATPEGITVLTSVFGMPGRYYADIDGQYLAAGSWVETSVAAGGDNAQCAGTPLQVIDWNIDGDEDVETQAIPSAVASPLCNCYLYCYDEEQQIEEGVEIEIQLLALPSTAVGRGDSAETLTLTSDANGLVSASLYRGARYQARRGPDGLWRGFTVPESGTYAIPSVVGVEEQT
jgi:hypothetical protein